MSGIIKLLLGFIAILKMTKSTLQLTLIMVSMFLSFTLVKPDI